MRRWVSRGGFDDRRHLTFAREPMQMTHSEFVAAVQAKQISVRANMSLALHVMNGNIMPMRYRAAHIFWTWVWFLMFPAALALGIWYSWWDALLCFMAAGPVKAGFKQSAGQFMLDHALENEAFYDAMMRVNMFHIDPAQPATHVAA
jgi:hypothetical protein